MRRLLLIVLTFASAIPMVAQTVSEIPISSELDRYIRTLRLAGLTTGDQQHIRMLETSQWYVQPGHVWDGQLPTNHAGFSVAQFSSYNSSHPHGGNDGALWQGRGMNTRTIIGWSRQFSLSDDLSLHLRLNPELLFMQNQDYEILSSAAGLTSEFGNYRQSPDVPQRFGDSPLLELDPGDSELRLTWRRLTTFIGTSHLWLGNAERNALIHSNNAPGYLKLGIGLLPAETRIGYVEALFSTGITSESSYYDTETSNDESILSLLSVSFRPHAIPGLTLGIHRSLLGDANRSTYGESLLTVLNPAMLTGLGQDEFDQRASITADWTFPDVGFSIYGEWARNDYSPGYRFVMRAPGHSQAYTIGLSQVLRHEDRRLTRFTLELSEIVNSFDYLLDLGTGGTFYSHGIVSQGYAHRGQIIGAEIGSGSDSQFFGVDHYLPWGRLGLFFSRVGRDKDYLYGDPANYTHNSPEVRGIERVNVDIAWGVSGAYLLHGMQVSMDLAYVQNMNWNWVAGNDLHGVRAVLDIRYFF